MLIGAINSETANLKMDIFTAGIPNIRISLSFFDRVNLTYGKL